MTGIMQMLLASQGPGPTYVASEFVETSSTNTLTIPKPAGAVAGNLMIAIMAASGGGSVGWSGASGWDEQADQGAFAHLRVATKVVTGSEPANYSFTFGAVADVGGYILLYDFADYDAIGAITAGGEDNPIAAGSVSLSTNGLIIAAYASVTADGTFSTPTGMTTLLSNSDADNLSFALFSQFANPGASGTRTSTPSEGTVGNAGVIIGLV